MYKDQHTPWKKSETVLASWETIELLARGNIQKFVHGWLKVETELAAMAACAVIYSKAKKEGDK